MADLPWTIIIIINLFSVDNKSLKTDYLQYILLIYININIKEKFKIAHINENHQWLIEVNYI